MPHVNEHGEHEAEGHQGDGYAGQGAPIAPRRRQALALGLMGHHGAGLLAAAAHPEARAVVLERDVRVVVGVPGTGGAVLQAGREAVGADAGRLGLVDHAEVLAAVVLALVLACG